MHFKWLFLITSYLQAFYIYQVDITHGYDPKLFGVLLNSNY